MKCLTTLLLDLVRTIANIPIAAVIQGLALAERELPRPQGENRGRRLIHHKGDAKVALDTGYSSAGAKNGSSKNGRRARTLTNFPEPQRLQNY